MAKRKRMSITVGSVWRWTNAADSANGTLWRVIGPPPKRPDKAPFTRAHILCISNDNSYWNGRELPYGDPYVEGWESADDPFVLFVRETIEDHKNAKR